MAHDEYVAVFKSDGSPDQCQHLGRYGLTPLAPYDAAAVRVLTLAKQLRSDQEAARCIPPHTLVQRVQRVLRRLGWTGWRAASWHRWRQVLANGRTGSCGMYEADGFSVSDPVASLDAQRHIVWIYMGPPRPY
jgi:hypothetical protein